MTNREFITSLSNPSAEGFHLLHALKIQAGNFKTFPWFYNLALKFDKYKLNSLKFIYEAKCPSTTAGSLVFVIYSDVN